MPVIFLNSRKFWRNCCLTMAKIFFFVAEFLKAITTTLNISSAHKLDLISAYSNGTKNIATAQVKYQQFDLFYQSCKPSYLSNVGDSFNTRIPFLTCYYLRLKNLHQIEHSRHTISVSYYDVDVVYQHTQMIKC